MLPRIEEVVRAKKVQRSNVLAYTCTHICYLVMAASWAIKHPPEARVQAFFTRLSVIIRFVPPIPHSQRCGSGASSPEEAYTYM